MRSALDEAGSTSREISYRISDLGGEQYYFKEPPSPSPASCAARTTCRNLWHPADGFGYTGAASIPLMLGVSLTAGRKAYAPGPIVLAQASHDDGRRGAMVAADGGLSR